MTWPTKTDFVDGDVLNASQMNNIGTNLNLANPTGITDGYVLTADGAGSMAWEAVPSGGMTTIVSGSLSGASLDIQNIPATYNALELSLLGAQFNTSNNWGLRMNAQTGPTNGYGTIRTYGTTNGNVQSSTSVQLDTTTWSGAQNVNMYFYFPRYSVSTWQVGYYRAQDQSAAIGGHAIFMYRDSQFIINRLQIFSLSGATFTAGTYLLRGLK